ncbi:MAG: hypothetical protein F7C08_03045 [Desulfurococcales archaeon]|nr:hypothetical protein [Desulfurococcales archaeon]MCE4605490.1 hypothetical protein [Desulfurococcales archaeon]
MGVEQLYLAYPAAVAMGLIHGSDPGHGWPLSVAYALRTESGLRKAVTYTSILAIGHFISTLAVVFAVWLLGSSAGVYLEYLKLGAGALLLLLAAKAFIGLRSHSHSHDYSEHGPAGSGLWEAFKYALLLGFAHEEEVALSAIVLLGAHPLLLSLAYGASVYASMIAWTLASLYLLNHRPGIRERLHDVLHIATPLFLAIVGAYVLADAILTLTS